jgi:hypothetical protein
VTVRGTQHGRLLALFLAAPGREVTLSEVFALGLVTVPTQPARNVQPHRVAKARLWLQWPAARSNPRQTAPLVQSSASFRQTGAITNE